MWPERKTQGMVKYIKMKQSPIRSEASLYKDERSETRRRSVIYIGLRYSPATFESLWI